MASGSFEPQVKNLNKKNGFYVFMEERKPILEENLDRKLKMRELSQLLSEDWPKLSPEAKEEYSAKARAYNHFVRGENKHERGNEQKRARAFQEATVETAQIQATVRLIFTSEDWASKTIVVCCFSTCFEPDSVANERSIPMEIGMTAFSLRNGVVDNFASFISSNDSIPRNRRVLETPAVVDSESQKKYVGLVDTIQRFLAMHHEELQNGPLYVFAFNTDLELTAKRLNWIFEAAGSPCPVKILDLSLYAYIASKANDPKYRDYFTKTKAATTGSFFTEDDFPMNSFCPNVSAGSSTFLPTSLNRTVDEPFNKCFVYSATFPMTRYGTFRAEKDVDDAIKSSGNYKYYNELNCVCHMIAGDASCALNQANRYVFSLLEILTMSNQVEAVPGAHFPTLDAPGDEWRRRVRMLSRWGNPKWETNLKRHEEMVARDKEEKEKREREHLQQRENREREWAEATMEWRGRQGSYQ